MFFKKLMLSLTASMALLFAAPATAAIAVSFGSVGVIDPNDTVICDGVTDCGGDLTGTFSNFFTSLGGQWAALPGNNTSQIAVLGGNSATLAVGQFITSLSFDWGTPDTYNYVDIVDSTNGLSTFAGSLIPGDQRVTFNFGAPTNVSSVTFRSTDNSFELDNISVGAVPEPATWAMMICGFGMAGTILRRRSSKQAFAA